LYGWPHLYRFGGQKIVHIQQFVIFGCTGQILQRIAGGGIVIGSCAAVLGVADVRMFEQIILEIHHRALPSDEQNALAVIQQPQLICARKFFATLSSDEFKKTAAAKKNLCGCRSNWRLEAKKSPVVPGK